jgi:hypothetical protein
VVGITLKAGGLELNPQELHLIITSGKQVANSAQKTTHLVVMDSLRLVKKGHSITWESEN